MFTFLSIMASGAFIGYLLRNKNNFQKLPNLIHIVVCALLFLLGLSVGVNQLIVSNLTYFCEQAAIISVLSMTGSLIAALALYHFCFKKEEENEG